MERKTKKNSKKLDGIEGLNEERKNWVKAQMRGREIIEKRVTSKITEEIVHKYSNNGKGQLKEAIIVNGESTFLRYSQDKGFLYLEPHIEEKTRELKAPQMDECPYEPYEFTAQSLNSYYLPLAKKETIDSLYQKIKSKVKQFNDVDNYVLNLLSMNVIGSYFQDRLSTVHYLFVVGGNGTGKSAFGDTFECLGYRPVNITNATEAFWYRVLGYVEYGQVTIIAEEIDKLDENTQIMNMLKTGYQPNAKVPRMDNNNDKLNFYFPFCFKILIAEKSPREDKARGVLDRTFKINSYKGYPQHKIKEIRNAQGNKIRQRLLNELMELRKILLIFKLIHYSDPLIEIDVGLDGRDEEVCKPLLQLFYSLGASKETQEELEQTLQYFLNIKNKRKQNSKEALIYPIMANAISKYGLKINAGTIWHEITESLEGQLDEKNPNIFHSADYPDFYRSTIIGMIADKFGAELDHKEKGNSIIFNQDIFTRMGKQYDNAKGIQTRLIPDSPDSPDSTPKELFTTQIEMDQNTNELEQILVSPYESDPSDESANINIEYPPDCYYCDQKFYGLEAYQSHVIQKHPGKPCFPGKADLQLYYLVAKDMPWEI